MTLTEHTPTPTPSVVTHPLQGLSADEIRSARQLLVDQGLVTETTRFAYLGLEEPPKADVLAHQPGTAVDRRVRAILLDTATGESTIVVASLTRSAIDSRRAVDPTVDGQPPILLEEFIAVDEIVKADPGWVAAINRRGI